ncbi:MAG: sialidase family protein [Verrucomicrobiota bacterium]
MILPKPTSGTIRAILLPALLAFIGSLVRPGLVAGEINLEFTNVFVAGDGGYRSIRIPSLATTRQGTLLAFAEGRGAPQDQAGNDLVLRRSQDGGRTWSPLQVVQEDGAHSLNNPTSVVDDATGRILLVYQRIPSHLKETSRETATGWEGTNIYRNLLTVSDDDGRTWSAPRDITRSTKRPETATTVASGPGAGIQLKRGAWGGRLIIPFNEGPYHQWNNYAIYSDDHGEHWKAGANVPGAVVHTGSSGPRSQINEVQVVELSDGSVRLNSRPFAGAPLRKTAVSHDGGETWSTVEDVPELPDPSCNAAILRVSDPQGVSPELIVFSGPFGTRRERGTLHASWDDGRSWPTSRLLWDGFFAYSALTVLPGGGIGCLFEADDYARIVFVRIPISWVGVRP